MLLQLSSTTNIDLFKAAYEALASKLILWFDLFAAALPNFILAIIVLVIFYFLAKGAKSLIIKLLEKWVDNTNLLDLASQTVFVIILLVGIFFALGVLNLDKTVTSLLAGAGVIGLALSFAFQDLATNFVSGVFITIQKPLRIGDLIETNDYTGIVRKIGLRAIDIEDFSGRYIIIPSKEVFQNPLVNYNQTKYRRINIAVGVSYGDDMKKVRKLLYDTIKTVEGVSTHPADARIDFDGFGDSSINFIAGFFINKPDQKSYKTIEIEAATAIKEAFDANDIMIPFPIRTLDFGIRGGEKLNEVFSLQDGKSNENPKNEN
ncbi:small-conductance mechanosensitive channel [Bernardetia litoralis DSM 6794]|uniref:Small-conductance mechanosensitive channel n=1 Tax=Bernardetia litoralis (strain ATCC 23117 / DSM 6794 / NBRC 15988 / NCIMB 1366 / Fx l1 / Sio-4) TaxID=880071 RepID=I4AQ29_BERLS|nr:mechanosensitive ion channel [Bernardetia litoralis]AFM06064.1 small-conductance mechanosensitive channel [Bernardetia litoralis DSM 6794]